MTVDNRIVRLEKEIAVEKREEERYADLYRPLIRQHDKLTKSILSAIFNREEARRLIAEMQRYADLANHHQARAAKLQRELSDLRAERAG